MPHWTAAQQCATCQPVGDGIEPEAKVSALSKSILDGSGPELVADARPKEW